MPARRIADPETHSVTPKLVKPRVMLTRSVWDLALDRVRYVYDQFDHIVVSFSGGKDSTATLHIALEVARERGRLPLHVVFFDEEAIPDDTVDYVRRVAARDDVSLDWYCLPVRHRNGCSVSSPEWFPWAEEVRDLWCREMPPEGIRAHPRFPMEVDRRPSIPEFGAALFPPDEYGQVAQLLGMRASESLMRMTSMMKKRGDNFITKDWHHWGAGNVYTAGPIYDWSTDDVWRAPARLGWDYNHAYDTMEMCGLTPHRQRCAPPFGEEPIKTLWTFQVCWPELWDKMSVRVPGANAAARYALTELYGIGGKLPPRPLDMPWETYLVGLIEKHEDPEIRSGTAHRLKTDMKRHFGKTSDPLVYRAMHPISGISWRYLAQLACRADMKDRRPQPYASATPEGREEAWRRYRAEWETYGPNADQVPE